MPKNLGSISDPKDIVTKEYVDGGKGVAFTVTLSASGWSSSEQTVGDSRFVTSGYAYTVSAAYDYISAYSGAAIYAEDVTVAGKMTFVCGSAPNADITVNILRTEVTE